MSAAPDESKNAADAPADAKAAANKVTTETTPIASKDKEDVSKKSSVGLIYTLGYPFICVAFIMCFSLCAIGNTLNANSSSAQFDMIYWPLHVGFFVISIVIFLFAAKHWDMKYVFYFIQLAVLYFVLIFLAYFLQLAGTNYVAQNNASSNTDQKLQMSAILSTYTVIIFLLGTIALAWKPFGWGNYLTGAIKDAKKAGNSMLLKDTSINDWDAKRKQIILLYGRTLNLCNSSAPSTDLATANKIFNDMMKGKENPTLSDAYKAITESFGRRDDSDVNIKLKCLNENTENKFMNDVFAILIDNKDVSGGQGWISTFKSAIVGAPTTTLTAKTTNNVIDAPNFVNTPLPKSIDFQQYEGPYIEILLIGDNIDDVIQIYSDTYIKPTNILVNIEGVPIGANTKIVNIINPKKL